MLDFLFPCMIIDVLSFVSNKLFFKNLSISSLYVATFLIDFSTDLEEDVCFFKIRNTVLNLTS